MRTPPTGESSAKKTISTGDLVETIPAARHDLTDAQWAVLKPLLPVSKKPGRPPIWPKRQLINGIRWRVRAGVPWRDVPPWYGPGESVYALFRRWQLARVWLSIFTALQARADAARLIIWDVSVDSTIARAHPHAAGGAGPARSAHGAVRMRAGAHRHPPGRGAGHAAFHRAAAAGPGRRTGAAR